MIPYYSFFPDVEKNFYAMIICFTAVRDLIDIIESKMYISNYMNVG